MSDVWERMAETESGRRIIAMFEDTARQRDGVARMTYWGAADGWTIAYTTSRVIGGPHDGKFVCQAFKPVGKGARSGEPSTLVETYRRAFSTRKAAKARAEALYAQHSKKK